MAQLTIADAAKRTGKSKTTIWRSVKSGRISATQDAAAQYQIDEAELARAFPYETVSGAAMQLREAANAPAEIASASVLAAKLEGAQAVIAELRARIGDLTGERDRLLARLPAPAQNSSLIIGRRIYALIIALLLAAAAVAAVIVRSGYIGSTLSF